MAGRMLRTGLRICGAFILIAAIALPAQGQTPFFGGSEKAPAPVEPPPDLQADEVAEFVAPLSDAQSRQLLIDTLRNDAAGRAAGAESGSTDLLRRVHEGSQRLSQERQAILESLANSDRHFAVALRNLTDNQGAPALIGGIGVFLLMVAAGLTAEWVAGRRLRDIRRGLTATTVASERRKLGILSLRLVLDLVLILVFAFVGWALSFLFFERYDPMRIFALAYLATITVTRVVWAASRAMFAPSAPELRLMDLADRWAQRLHRWTVAIFAVGSFTFFTCSLFQILGLDDYLHRFLLIASDGLVTAILIGMIWTSRSAVAARLTGYAPQSGTDLADTADGAFEATVAESPSERGAGALRQGFAQAWHLLATAYLIAMWWFYSRNVVLGAIEASDAAVASVVILLCIPIVDAVLRTLLEPASRHPGSTDQTLGARYGHSIRLVARAAMIFWLLTEVAEAAGFALFGVMATPFGERIKEGLLDIGAALVIGYLIWELVKNAIDRHMPQDEGGVAMGEEGGAAGKATRAATLLPLLRSFVLTFLIVMVTLIILSSIGVNIGPLLAGAGVVGLAVGFGSQKLVQDIVAGIFFLVDDAFRIGEYIEAGGMKGTVESISLRSMRLRHHLGAVQTLPYGEIQAVKNHSRDWVTMKLEIRLPYDVDIEKVRKTIKKTGQQMLENPEYGHFFLQPLKSQGVFRVEDSALIVRMKFTTVPNEQWVIRREAYRLVKEALAAQGIEFAHRQVFVNVPATEKGDDEATSKHAAAAAAAIQAAEEQRAEAAAGEVTDER